MSTIEPTSDKLQVERQRVWDEARQHFEHRELIEQAKGMLMFVYGVDADGAFEVLRSHSQQHNTKLRVVAEQILKDLTALARTKGPARRLAFDGLIGAAQRRVHDVAARRLDVQGKPDVPVTGPGSTIARGPE